MKTLIAVMLSMCLLMGCAFAETALTEISWSDFETMAAEIEGEFRLVADTGLKMYIPADMSEREMTQETIDKGFLLVMGNEDDTFFLAGSVYEGTIVHFKARFASFNAYQKAGPFPCGQSLFICPAY